MAILKKILLVFLRIIISIVLLLFLFRHIDERSLVGVIKGANKPVLFLALIIFFLTYILCFLRWLMLLRAIKINLPLARVIISFSGGTFFNLIMPSTIGGDFIRSVDLASHTKRPREVIATVLLDRLSGYIALAILALAASLLGWQYIHENKVALFVVSLVVVVLLTILVFLFNNFVYSKVHKFFSSSFGKIGEAIKNLHHEIYLFRNRKKIIYYNLLVSLAAQLLAPVSFYLIAIALGVRINIFYFFIFIPLVGAITMLPISIGGLGLRDWSMLLFFSGVGVPKDLAVAISLLSFFFIVIFGVLGGLVYVFTVRSRRLQYHQSPVVFTDKKTLP